MRDDLRRELIAELARLRAKERALRGELAAVTELLRRSRARAVDLEEQVVAAEARADAVERATADAIADQIEAVGEWPTEGVSAERARIGGWVNNMRSLAMLIARNFPDRGVPHSLRVDRVSTPAEFQRRWEAAAGGRMRPNQRRR